MIKYVLIILGVSLSALAQIFLKKSSEFNFKDFHFYLLIGLAILAYFFSFLLYHFILKFFDLIKISPIMTISTMILVVISGSLLFQETFSLKNWIGIVLGLISIILLIKG